ncbi:MAG: hypothetical protein ABIX01_19940 [Chitinophagaceae bacterium]
MKNAIRVFVLSILFALFLGCHKNKDLVEDPIVVPAATLVDPANWNASVTQTNANARQCNYGKVKIIKALSVIINGMNAGGISVYNLHVYLPSTSGVYLHLPSSSINGVAYNYYLKSSIPNSMLFITRATGVEETYNDVILLAAKLTSLQSLPELINFVGYGAAKAKTGVLSTRYYPLWGHLLTHS